MLIRKWWWKFFFSYYLDNILKQKIDETEPVIKQSEERLKLHQEKFKNLISKSQEENDWSHENWLLKRALTLSEHKLERENDYLENKGENGFIAGGQAMFDGLGIQLEGYLTVGVINKIDESKLNDIQEKVSKKIPLTDGEDSFAKSMKLLKKSKPKSTWIQIQF